MAPQREQSAEGDCGQSRLGYGGERGSRKTSRYGFPAPGGLDTPLQKKSCLTCFSSKGELLEGNRQAMPLCPGENFPLAFKS